MSEDSKYDSPASMPEEQKSGGGYLKTRGTHLVELTGMTLETHPDSGKPWVHLAFTMLTPDTATNLPQRAIVGDELIHRYNIDKFDFNKYLDLIDLRKFLATLSTAGGEEGKPPEFFTWSLIKSKICGDKFPGKGQKMWCRGWSSREKLPTDKKRGTGPFKDWVNLDWKVAVGE